MSGIVIRIILAVICVTTTSADSKVGSENDSHYNVESGLRSYLLSSYDKTVAPREDINDNVTVEFGLTLQAIDNFDVERGVLTTHVWLQMSWTDVRLKWTAADHNGLDSIRLSPVNVWLPDIVPYNNAGKSFGPSADYYVHVSSDGLLSYIPHILLSTTCAADLEYFPFDQQACTIKFGSWTYSGKVIVLVGMGETVDTSTYTQSKAWDLQDAVAKINSMKYECCPETYYDYTATLRMRRRTSVITNMYIGPAACIGLLMPAVFLLPAWSAHKLVLGSGLLISQILLLDMIVEILPINDFQAPRLALYYLANIVLLSLSLGLSAVIICLWERAKRGGPGVPVCFDQVFLGLFGKILCVKRDDYVDEHDSENTSKPAQTSLDDQAAMVKEYTRLVAPAEWRQFSVVLDRLLMVVFLVVAIATVIALMAYPGY